MQRARNEEQGKSLEFWFWFEALEDERVQTFNTQLDCCGLG